MEDYTEGQKDSLYGLLRRMERKARRGKRRAFFRKLLGRKEPEQGWVVQSEPASSADAALQQILDSGGWEGTHIAVVDGLCICCEENPPRVLPAPIPEGTPVMFSEAIAGRGLYCEQCFAGQP